MKRSNLLIIMEALELQIPIIYKGGIFRLYGDNLTTGVWKGDEMAYMGDFDWKFIPAMARELSEEEIINIVHLIIQVRKSLEAGVILENLTFPFEDEWFVKAKHVKTNAK